MLADSRDPLNNSSAPAAISPSTNIDSPPTLQFTNSASYLDSGSSPDLMAMLY